MLTLTTGSFRDIETAFLREIGERRKKDPLAPLLVVSPSGHLLTRLQTEMSKRHPACLNIHFVSFYGLADRLTSETTPAGRMVAEPALYSEIIRDLLEGESDVEFLLRKELHPSNRPLSKGLPRALAATLRDLRDSGVRVVDALRVALEGHLGEAAADAAPALELYARMYEALQKRGLRTPADQMRRAAQQIAKDSWIRNQRAVFLYGFYDLTGVQMDFVLAFSRHPDARLYAPCVAGNPAHAFAQRLLLDPAFTGKIGRKIDLSKKTTPERSGAAAPPFAPHTEIWSCSGLHDEVWLAAKKILELSRQGVPYHEMCLTMRTLDPYLGVAREVLEAHRIPYSLHGEEPVGAWPLVKNARAALRNAPGAPKASWSSHSNFARRHLETALQRPLDMSQTEQKLWEGLQSSLASLAELDALDRPISWARFLETAEEKLDGLRLQLAPDNNLGVQIMDVMAARGLAFRAVFLIGLNEKLFPRLIREDPFLADAARSALAQAVGCRIPRKLDGYQEERLLFALSVEMASERLHLSFQRSDEEGKVLVTSLYLQDVVDRAGANIRRLSRAWADKIREIPPDTLTPKEVSLAMNRDGEDPSVLYRELSWDHALYTHLVRSQREIEAFGALGPHDGLIGEKHPAALRLLQKGLSPATLKDLAECPFKVYARKALSLDPETSPVEEGIATRVGVGSLIHEILERFYREGRNDLERVENEAFRRFEKDHPELYRLPWLAEQDRIGSILEQFIKVDSEELNENDFIPTEFEIDLSFHMESTNNVLVRGRIDRLDLRQGINPAFRVVDYKTGNGGVKKGEKIETAILKGKVFQLPIYLLLAQEWARKKGLPPESLAKAGSALFYNIQKPNAVEEPLEITSIFWSEHGDLFNKNMKFLIKDIDKGYFYIRPSDGRGHCSWCHFATLCRKVHKPTRIRSENSPHRKEHEECFSRRP